MKCEVHIFTGSFGSSGSPVHLRTSNNLYCVKGGVHVFNGSFGVWLKVALYSVANRFCKLNVCVCLCKS